MTAGARRRVRDFVDAHLRSRQVSRVLYGSIIGLAVVVALQDHPPGAGNIAATLAATGVAVGLAELYSNIVGTAARTQARLDHRQRSDAIVETIAVTLGTAFPALFFLLAALGVMEIDTAFTIAKWSGLGLITAYGFAAARLTGETVAGSLWRAALAAVAAALLIVVKALLH
jgi:hypothetical protein